MQFGAVSHQILTACKSMRSFLKKHIKKQINISYQSISQNNMFLKDSFFNIFNSFIIKAP